MRTGIDWIDAPEAEVYVPRPANGLFPKLQPEVGRIHKAKMLPIDIFRDGVKQKSAVAVIDVGSKPIILRQYPREPWLDEFFVARRNANMEKCPVCGDYAAYIYLRGIEPVGCECCISMVDAAEVDDQEDCDDVEW